MKNNLKYLFIAVLVLIVTNTFAQVGIGTDTPAASAALEVSSSTNNKGILIPRVTAAQKDAISNPAEGLMVYQTSAPAGFYFYTGTAWKLMVTQTDIDLKVTKVTGKDLSSNDYTSAEKTKLSNLSGTNTGDQDLSTLATAASVALKANTADVSTSLASKVDKVIGKDLSSNDYTTAEKTKVSNLSGTNTGDQDLSALATAASVALKANTADVSTSLASKVDKVIGKDLSSNDYTTAEKAKLSNLLGTNTGDQDLSILATAASVALKANTADVSAAMALKANATDLTSGLATKVDKVIGKDLSSNDYTSAEKTKLSAITGTNTGDQDLSALATNTALALKSNSTDVTASLATKVDKTTGKDLSTNDYTSAEKTKLAAIVGSNTGDQTTITGNAGTATKLAAPININGVAFDGSADITVPADANTLSGTAIKSTVTGSSLTSVGTLANLTVTAPIVGSVTGTSNNVTGIVAIANGGTNSTATPTAGGIGYGTGTALGYTAAGTAGQVLSSNNTGIPTWITPSSVAVPYTGAIAAVDLGAYDLKVNGLTVGTGTGSLAASNTVIGNSALLANTTGQENTAIGFISLSANTTGSSNTATGAYALLANTEGTFNTASGVSSLYSNTSGSYNTANGGQSLNSNTTGEGNTGEGMNSLYANTTGSSNTATGFHALSANTTGSYNTANGKNSLSANTTGIRNTAIGDRADVGSGALTNATAIGAGAIVSASNTIQLGNTDVTNVKTSGNITAGAVTYPKTDGAAGTVLTANANGIPTWTAVAGLLPSSGNSTGDMLYWNGFAWVKVSVGADGHFLTLKSGIPTWSGDLTDITNPVTGKIWMDRNLGAIQVARSSTDALAYGDLYQWGRGADGHQLRKSGTTDILSANDNPGNNNFITDLVISSSHSNGLTQDWRNPQNINLWQGVSGTNNPCPSGYRVPTSTEWDAERVSWSSLDPAGAFASPLKLPMAGYRDGQFGNINAGTRGDYWSSSIVSTLSTKLFFDSAGSGTYNDYRVSGFSVRCIKD